jgi:hypothetical protein
MSQSDNDYSKESNKNFIILLSSHQRARRMQRNGTTDATSWQLLKPPLSLVGAVEQHKGAFVHSIDYTPPALLVTATSSVVDF